MTGQVDEEWVAAQYPDADPGHGEDGEAAAGLVGEAPPGYLADGWRATDAGNAQRLVDFASGSIRYAPRWAKWLIYRKGRWDIDNDGVLIAGQAQLTIRRLFTAAAKEPDRTERDKLWKWAQQSEKAPAIRAMTYLARPYVRIDENELDADPWLQNVRNGTVDMRTGKLRPHNPRDLLTMQAPVTFDPDAQAPLWLECVERWQPDPDRRAFLQKAAGTGTTGIPIERGFVNLGPGGNGKTKFFEAIKATIGPYYVVPDESLLVVTKYEPHATVRAKLFRTRMVVGAETDQSARLADAKIKALTGGDSLTAHRMREDEFEFNQTWTLFLHTNHRPKVRDSSAGMWRRLRLITWDVTIPEDEQDEHLASKLAAEAPGILNWLIEGCLAWQRDGWNDPPSVTEATQAWRADEDTFTRWLDDCTVTDPACWAAAAALYDSYERWCQTSGETPVSKKAFGTELGKRFEEDRRYVGGKRVRVWLGLKLVDGYDTARADEIIREAFGESAGQS